MSKIFTIDMLAADNGDALWLRFGEPDAITNILVDVGYASSLKRLFDSGVFGTRTLEAPFVIDLLVVTHTDQDHISGAYKLLTEAKRRHFQIQHVWFNGYRQLFPSSGSDDSLGYPDGEKLSAAIDFFRIPHNKHPARPEQNLCESGNIVASFEGLPCTEIAGLTLTVLGPESKGLDALRAEWISKQGGQLGTTYKDTTQKLKAKEDSLGPTREPGGDSGVPNGSSIALLAEYADIRVLLAGDAHAQDLLAALERVPERSGPLVDFFKLPHHGSVGNVTDALIAKAGSPHYLVSTSGSAHDHPHKETIQLVMDSIPSRTPHFHFNYDAPRDRIQKEFQPTVIGLGHCPGPSGLRIDLMGYMMEPGLVQAAVLDDLKPGNCRS